jgi:NAD(P)-dependent dehydrogenase (short-subunit alcohol dehydrogenase family)
MKRLNLATLAAAATATAAGIAVVSVASAVVASAVVATGAAVLVVRAVRSRKNSPLAADPNAPRPVVLVTGGSRGLGLAIATRFAAGSGIQRPARLVLASRNLAELQQAQETLLAQFAHLRPEDFHLVAADLSKPEEAQRLIDEAIERYGRIDVLINNAGIIDVGPIESQTLEIFERTMQVNFFAALYTIWAALPHLRKQPPLAGTRRASIVNIASIGGKIAVPHLLPYSAAKFALVGFSEGLHAELRHKGIRVTTVCPGLMRTGGENHVNIVGDVEFERRWFTFAAKTPGLSVSTRYAANKIFHAVAAGRAEITISPQAWLAARVAGVFPETLQYANALTNHHILPKAPSEL